MRNIATVLQDFSSKCRTLKDKLRLADDKITKKRNVENLLSNCSSIGIIQTTRQNNSNLWNQCTVNFGMPVELIEIQTLFNRNKISANAVFIVSNNKVTENKSGKRHLLRCSEFIKSIKNDLKWKPQSRNEWTSAVRDKRTVLQYGAVPVAASIAPEINGTSGVTEKIPEPPPIPEVSTETLNQLNALGEPTFESLGLGGLSPVGLVQSALEYIHVTMGLPWWGTIALGTVIVRLLMFPLVVVSQRNAARMNNYLPQMQVLQLKMTEARQTGNQLDAARYSQELMLFMKEKGLNPLKNMIVPLAQAPLFISFFMSLRQMANTPVESLKDGGILWFTDLCVPDQYFGLPIITSLTLWATIELGTDTAKLSSQNMHIMKYVLRGLPVVIFPFTMNFPGAILCYWVSTNFISLLQVGFLRIPSVRDYFKIEPLITHKPENLPIKSKGFLGGIKDSWTNIKVSRELEDRQRFDEMQFKRAGRGPIVKTYKYDPTKRTPEKPVINAKKR